MCSNVASESGWDENDDFSTLPLTSLFPFSRSNVDVSAAALDDDGHLDGRRGASRGDGGPHDGRREPAAPPPLVVAAEDERLSDVAAAAALLLLGAGPASDDLRDDPSSSRADRRLRYNDAREELVSRIVSTFHALVGTLSKMRRMLTVQCGPSQ